VQPKGKSAIYPTTDSCELIFTDDNIESCPFGDDETPLEIHDELARMIEGVEILDSFPSEPEEMPIDEITRFKELSSLVAYPLEFYEDVCSTRMAKITADLSTTDEQLLIDFKVWLREQRKVSGADAKTTRRNFTDRDMQRWVKDRLLPYIDLAIFNDYYRLELTQVDIANHIHSDDVKTDVVDKTRRTTRPKALKLFTSQIARQLEIQISCMAVKD